MASTRADIMQVMALEVGRPEQFGARRASGYIRNFKRMTVFRNGGGLTKGNRIPNRVRVWQSQDVKNQF